MGIVDYRLGVLREVPLSNRLVAEGRFSKLVGAGRFGTPIVWIFQIALVSGSTAEKAELD